MQGSIFICMCLSWQTTTITFQSFRRHWLLLYRIQGLNLMGETTLNKDFHKPWNSVASDQQVLKLKLIRISIFHFSSLAHSSSEHVEMYVVVSLKIPKKEVRPR